MGNESQENYNKAVEAHNKDMAIVEKRQLKYQKLAFAMSFITMLMVAAIMVVIVGAVLYVKPMITDIYDSTMISLQNMETLTDDLNKEMKEADLEGTVKNINSLTVKATDDLTDAMDRLNSIDFETLNKAIKNLNDTVEPLARLFR
ncbi:MAG: hypothetical protein K5686_06355 [Lachnospiraceae bacterium]|nr:hypothetical protein [Lachnospiraceae bacterium]